MEKAYTMAEEPYTRIYARIDLDAIVKNMEAMRENLPAKTKMIGVVKTDGYGHGQQLSFSGISAFGITNASPYTLLNLCTISRHCSIIGS